MNKTEKLWICATFRDQRAARFCLLQYLVFFSHPLYLCTNYSVIPYLSWEVISMAHVIFQNPESFIENMPNEHISYTTIQNSTVTCEITDLTRNVITQIISSNHTHTHTHLHSIQHNVRPYGKPNRS